MTDRLTPAQRHLVMSHIRSRNTKPELKVRQWLWRHGYRYRLNVKGVPGKPDIVMRRYHTAIFVNRCFWHGHHMEVRGERLEVRGGEAKCCKIPQTNTRDQTKRKIDPSESSEPEFFVAETVEELHKLLFH